MTADGICSVETCDRPIVKRAWCGAHYNRFIKDGDVRADVPLRPRYSGVRRTSCEVDGCDRQPEGSRALCGAHRARKARLGDLRADVPVRTLSSRRTVPLAPNSWGYSFDEPCSYQAAHDRVRGIKGRAKDQACVICKAPALHWAYSGRAKHEFSGTRAGDAYDYEMFWSGNPADYDPMCGSCHKAHDTQLAHLRWLEGISPELAQRVREILQAPAPGVGA